MRAFRRVLMIIGVLGAGVALYVWATQWPLIHKVDVPQRADFDQAAIARGARLAELGNCRVCHTAAGGADYAGNRPIATPFGTVYSSNITPAPGSGIGHWSEAAFTRAMRDGISRRGRHLYPAFPYPHFAQLSDADVHALYAFVMTRRPVETYQLDNDLPFPLGERWLLRFWNLLFFDKSPFRPDPQHNAEWNRGAYLVTGLGHCGDCHTPRNRLGGERSGAALAGGEAEGWTAPALNAASPAPVAWDAAHLFLYLRQGWDVQHGAAAGPMREVVAGLAQTDAADVHAIAAYLASQQGEVSAARRERGVKALAQAAALRPPAPAPGEELGAALFAGACARCHVGGPAMVPPHGVDLALSSAVSEADPRNAIHLVLDGIEPGGERAGPMMPGFAAAFSDAQVAALLGYVRAHYGGGGAPWADLAAQVHARRNGNRKGPP